MIIDLEKVQHITLELKEGERITADELMAMAEKKFGKGVVFMGYTAANLGISQIRTTSGSTTNYYFKHRR